MALQDDVRRIALALPEVVESDDDFAFSVYVKGKRKGIVWSWKERIHPKKARVPSSTVVAIRTIDLEDKTALLASDPDGEKLFTEQHYNGYPAILVRLAAIGVDELAELIEDAWRVQAPPELVEAYDSSA
jgi:hypothetical protein